jgi:hypothetical protein
MENILNEENGSCGCGSVKFKLRAEILNIVNCHCKMCRSHNGTSFSTYAVLPHSALEVTIGKDLVNRYTAGSAQKHFCGKCGTPLFNLNEKYPGVCMIYAGTLDSSDRIAPKINVWCESKLAWLDTLSEITSMPQGIERK